MKVNATRAPDCAVIVASRAAGTLRGPEEQAHLDDFRRKSPESGGEMARSYWKERLRAARRVFNDPRQIEEIVAILETADGPGH